MKLIWRKQVASPKTWEKLCKEVSGGEVDDRDKEEEMR
jgi:hypothetical protein